MRTRVLGSVAPVLGNSAARAEEILAIEPINQEQPDFSEPPLLLDGAADHWNFREDDDDYYSQPRFLFRLMSPAQQQALFENTARSIGAAPKEIQNRHIRNCLKADPAYGKGVADALGLLLSDVSAGEVELTTLG